MFSDAIKYRTVSTTAFETTNRNHVPVAPLQVKRIKSFEKHAIFDTLSGRNAREGIPAIFAEHESTFST